MSRNRPGRGVGVDGGLDRQDEVGRALNLVDDRPVETANETHGIGGRGVEGSGVVKGDEGDGVCRDPLSQGSLAGLPGAAQQHDSGVPQGLPHPPFDKSRIHAVFLDF